MDMSFDAFRKAAEVELIGEDELVKIRPKFSHPVMHFIYRDIGPFEPSVDVKVPLWLAITLKKRLKCNIVPPEWLSTEQIQALAKHEELLREGFQQLPSPHFMEITFQLLKYRGSFRKVRKKPG